MTQVETRVIRVSIKVYDELMDVRDRLLLRSFDEAIQFIRWGRPLP